MRDLGGREGKQGEEEGDGRKQMAHLNIMVYLLKRSGRGFGGDTP